MNSKILFFCLFISALLVIGCISEFNANTSFNDQQMLIVDGYIMENMESVFYLSKSFPMNTLEKIPESIYNIDAKLTIIGNDGYESDPAINRGKGVYKLFLEELKDDVEYGIKIEYEGNIYQSTLSKPIYTPEIDSLSWIQPEVAGAVTIRLSTHDDLKSARFYIWNYTETWEIAASIPTRVFLDTITLRFFETDPSDLPPYYYCWKSSESNKYIIGTTESLGENKVINKPLYEKDIREGCFRELYSVYVNQKAISKDAYEYYQNKIKLNEEMGGLFTPQPSELIGNISCITNPSKKVMGFVGVSKNTTQKRLFVHPERLTHPRYYDDCATITADSMLSLMREDNYNYRDVYRMGYRPTGILVGMNPENRTPTEWSIVSCTDCTSNGSKDKPDYWPNYHE